MRNPPERAWEQTDDLVAMIAHDLRGPVTAIKGFSQLALRQPDLAPPVRTCLTITINEANRIASLIDDLVLLSRLDRGAAISTEHVDVAEVLQAAVERLSDVQLTTRVVLEERLAEAMAWCNPSITERAVALLIGTAQKYCVGSESIGIELRGGEDGVVVGIVPSHAVAAEKLPALRRVVGSAEAAPTDALTASGLGLYICRRLIELQGGRVWLDQAPTAHTCFLLMLPARDARDQTPSRGECQPWS